MGTINTADFKKGQYLEIDGSPYLLVENTFVRPGKGQAFNVTRIKNLITKNTIEKTFKSGEEIKEADIETVEVTYLYSDDDSAHFMEPATSEMREIAHAQIGENKQWLKEDTTFQIVYFNGKPIELVPPTFMHLKVIETVGDVDAGNTGGKVLKEATLETGAVVQVAKFIKVGESVKVDTRTSEYVERSKL